MLKKLYDKLGQCIHSPYATIILAALFFIEAIFFVPVDPLLILYCIENRPKSLYYALVATIASVAGGVMAYYVGYGLWETCGQRLVSILFTPAQFEYAINQFKQYESWAVFIGGFTPLPYKAITLSAGFCKLPLLPFVFFSLLARGARFFLVAGVISIWGDPIKQYIDRYFNFLVVLFTGVVLATVWLVL